MIVPAAIDRARGCARRDHPRPMRTARAGALLGAVVLLLASFPGVSTLRAQDAEVTWTEVSSGEAEIRLGDSFDLDFRDPRASGNDFQFEPWEGGSFWAPKVGCKAGLTAASDFASLPIEKASDVPLSSDRLYLCGGSQDPLKPGTILIATTSDARYAKVSIDACGPTLKFHYITYDRKVVKPAAVVAGLAAPQPTSPPDGITFDHTPRDLLLTWRAVPGATGYVLELDCRGCCPPRKELFCGEQEHGTVFLTQSDLVTPAFYTVWQGAYPGRWRVSAVKSQKGGAPQSSPWSSWSSFTFKP